MPKMKSHSGMKKRVKITGSGKLVHQGSGKRHNLENKSSKRIRQMDSHTSVAAVDVPRIKRMLGI